jgi:hypothetical protein
MRLNLIGERLGPLLIPLAVLFINRREIDAGAEPERVQQIAVRREIVWSQRQRPAEAVDSLRHLPLILERIAQVVPGLGILRLQL